MQEVVRGRTAGVGRKGRTAPSLDGSQRMAIKQSQTRQTAHSRNKRLLLTRWLVQSRTSFRHLCRAQVPECCDWSKTLISRAQMSLAILTPEGSAPPLTDHGAAPRADLGAKHRIMGEEHNEHRFVLSDRHMWYMGPESHDKAGSGRGGRSGRGKCSCNERIAG